MASDGARGLLMVGVGGQGVILASDIVADALMRAGHDVKKSEVHGMAQRGGVVYSHVRYGARVASPLLARGTAEVLVAFEWAEALRWLPYVGPDGVVIASVDRIVPPVACSDRRAWALRYPTLDASALRARAGEARLVDARAVARDLGDRKAAGSVLLGVASLVLDVPTPAWEEAIRAGVPPRATEVNLVGFRAGRDMAFPDGSQLPVSERVVQPAPSVRREPPRIEIVRAWCKGCDICVRFCPETCLALDEEEKVVVVDPEACTGCRLCELLCPDFAIAIRTPVLAAAGNGGRRG